MHTIMKLTHQLREYDREKEKEIKKMFNLDGEPMFDDPEFFNAYDKNSHWDEKEINIL